MYYYLNGTLALRDITTCVVDCGGVGYKLSVSLLTSESLASKVGERVKLYTHLAVREDGIELFGFGNEAERRAFSLLIGVSGVGPKAAINILSVMTPDRLTMAICTEDIKSISKAPNVGAKTAARIVLELKDKIAKEFPSMGGDTAGTIAASHVTSGNMSEAVEALTVLGYDKNTALSALRGINTAGMETGDIIKAALKKLAR